MTRSAPVARPQIVCIQWLSVMLEEHRSAFQAALLTKRPTITRPLCTRLPVRCRFPRGTPSPAYCVACVHLQYTQDSRTAPCGSPFVLVVVPVLYQPSLRDSSPANATLRGAILANATQNDVIGFVAGTLHWQGVLGNLAATATHSLVRASVKTWVRSTRPALLSACH